MADPVPPPASDVQHSDGFAYREAPPAGGDGSRTALLLHGYPESSWMWRAVLPALAERGWRAVAPDLPGFGDSPADRPGTWRRQVEAVERFRTGLGLEHVALVVHDWGGLIGLRWACDHPEAVSALVVSNTGFFTDGRWSGMAEALRTEGQGEQVVEGMTLEGFAAVLGSVSPGIDERSAAEYFKAFADADRRAGQLELYRSGDFGELAALRGLPGPARGPRAGAVGRAGRLRARRRRPPSARRAARLAARRAARRRPLRLRRRA